MLVLHSSISCCIYLTSLTSQHTCLRMVAKTGQLITTVHTQMIYLTVHGAMHTQSSVPQLMVYVWLLVFLLHSTLWPSRPLLREASVVQIQLNLPLQMRSGVIVHVTTRDIFNPQSVDIKAALFSLTLSSRRKFLNFERMRSSSHGPRGNTTRSFAHQGSTRTC